MGSTAPNYEGMPVPGAVDAAMDEAEAAELAFMRATSAVLRAALDRSAQLALAQAALTRRVAGQELERAEDDRFLEFADDQFPTLPA